MDNLACFTTNKQVAVDDTDDAVVRFQHYGDAASTQPRHDSAETRSGQASFSLSLSLASSNPQRNRLRDTIPYDHAGIPSTDLMIIAKRFVRCQSRFHFRTKGVTFKVNIDGCRECT